MTIIVAVRKGNRAVLAADTAESEGSMLIPAGYRANHTKIIKHRRALLGMAGWSAVSDAMESVLRGEPDILDTSSRAAVYESFRRIHDVLKKDHYIETREDEKEQPVESSQVDTLILTPEAIYSVESYRSVAEYTRFWAIGSGTRLALGAIYSLYRRMDNPRDIARAGVAAACEFDDACMLPLEVRALRGA